MRAYNILPIPVIQAANLSKEGLKRLEWLDWYTTHGKNASLTCRHFGISRDTFYLWKRRFNPKNLRTLEFDTRTRRPKRVREMTTDPVILKRIYDIRLLDKRKSKYEIYEELKREGIRVAHKVIQKVINRHTELLNTQHAKRLKQRRKLKIARVKAAVELREKTLGSLVQMDTKYLYILGQRFFVFSAIDCKSRYAFIYCYKTISSASGRDFLRRVKAYFPFPIHAVNTDNGSEYLLHFHEELEKVWKIPHYFTDPHCPKQNGRVERLHQTAEYEYFNYQDVLPELEDVRTHCMQFNTWYNTQRFHHTLNYKTPMEFVQENLVQKGVYGI